MARSQLKAPWRLPAAILLGGTAIIKMPADNLDQLINTRSLMISRCCIRDIAPGLRWQLQADRTSVPFLGGGGDVNQDAMIIGACNADGAEVSLPMVDNIKCSRPETRSQSIEKANDGLILLELRAHGVRTAA